MFLEELSPTSRIVLKNPKETLWFSCMFASRTTILQYRLCLKDFIHFLFDQTHQLFRILYQNSDLAE